MGEWIDVKKQRPSKTWTEGGSPVYYLCKEKHGGRMFVGCCISESYGGCAYQVFHEEGTLRDITHWMPLPKAPSEGG